MTRKLFGTDGVRGRANSWPMTADLALKLGAGRDVAVAALDARGKVLAKALIPSLEAPTDLVPRTATVELPGAGAVSGFLLERVGYTWFFAFAFLAAVALSRFRFRSRKSIVVAILVAAGLLPALGFQSPVGRGIQSGARKQAGRINNCTF